MIPNKIRIELIKCLADSDYLFTPDDNAYTEIYRNGITIKVDFSCKYGTGTGRILSISTENRNPLPETLMGIDNLIIATVISHRKNLEANLEFINETLKTVDNPPEEL